MRTLIKLAIAVLILNATWRVAGTYWEHYQFEDGVQNVAQFSSGQTDDWVLAQVVDLATSYAIPVDPANIVIRRDNNRIFIEAAYTRQIEVAPRFPVRWDFKVSQSAFTVPRGSIK